jgi:hypothetical protein
VPNGMAMVSAKLIAREALGSILVLWCQDIHLKHWQQRTCTKCTSLLLKKWKTLKTGLHGFLQIVWGQKRCAKTNAEQSFLRGISCLTKSLEWPYLEFFFVSFLFLKCNLSCRLYILFLKSWTSY